MERKGKYFSKKIDFCYKQFDRSWAFHKNFMGLPCDEYCFERNNSFKRNYCIQGRS